MSLMNSEDERSYSTLNLFYFVLKFFFEPKKSSMNMAMNSHRIFQLAEIGSKMNSLPCSDTLSYEKREGKIMQKVFKKHSMQSYVVGVLVKNLLIFVQLFQ